MDCLGAEERLHSIAVLVSTLELGQCSTSSVVQLVAVLCSVGLEVQIQLRIHIEVNAFVIETGLVERILNISNCIGKVFLELGVVVRQCVVEDLHHLFGVCMSAAADQHRQRQRTDHNGRKDLFQLHSFSS